MDPNKNSSSKSKKSDKGGVRTQNVIESLKDISSNTAQTAKNDLLKGIPEDLLRQIMGRGMSPKKISGELRPGESMEMDKAYTGEHEKAQKINRETIALNRLRQEEMTVSERTSSHLRVQLKALQEELIKLVGSTQKLAKETQVAAMIAPVEESEYSIGYITHIIEFIKSFRKKMNSSSSCLHSSNTRAQKKNFWSQYKDKRRGGSQHLLNSETYLTRSAG